MKWHWNIFFFHLKKKRGVIADYTTAAGNVWWVYVLLKRWVAVQRGCGCRCCCALSCEVSKTQLLLVKWRQLFPCEICALFDPALEGINVGRQKTEELNTPLFVVKISCPCEWQLQNWFISLLIYLFLILALLGFHRHHPLLGPTATAAFCLFRSHVSTCPTQQDFYFFAGGCKQRDELVFVYFFPGVLKMATTWQNNKTTFWCLWPEFELLLPISKTCCHSSVISCNIHPSIYFYPHLSCPEGFLWLVADIKQPKAECNLKIWSAVCPFCPCFEPTG